MSFLKPSIHTLLFTLAVYQPMQRVYIDTIGPFPPDERGNKFILAIIDAFSRLVEIIGLPDVTAHFAARSLLQHVGRFGAPDYISSDNGRQFVNQIIEELFKLMGIEHSLTTVALSTSRICF